MEKTKAWKVTEGFRTLMSALHLPTQTRLRRFSKLEQQAQDRETLAFKKQEAAVQMARDKVPTREMLSNFYW